MIAGAMAACAAVALATTVAVALPLASGTQSPAIEVTQASHAGRKATRVVDRAGLVSAERLVPLPGPAFHDGVIDGYLTGMPTPGSSPGARGFVGIAFRINGVPKRYDVLYVRMTNGRAPDQLRRNRTVQYEYEPDFPWDRLRASAPGQYESYADVAVGRWVKFRIEVRGDKARLYLNGSDQPALVVNDLRSGPDGAGAVALQIGPETIGYFSDVRVRPG
ncbi:hypothetical protein FHS95_000911 [Sphingomonas naasensis]|uniref:DUF1080 domain-containing protein n=1 Tax=Sphingomonas naasensis TaxID=1344951 RepID=A0A4S1WTJ8_9SPHN|nr:hypothetical protein [Sphingomonas naasensis]NIJ19242.1 hypothetical protein [Sphingomonas naasensis]TGX46423.1 hypothetical protein E5A74_04545 [Sphingomonas naasensis]